MARPAVGFIGLGIMGLPMAATIQKAGYPLTVHTRTVARADRVVACGATVVDTPARVARSSQIVITMLPDSPDVTSVVEGAEGVIAGSSPGTTWIDMSSISPLVARRLADKARSAGIDCLDAPVSGGERGATDGTLSIMVGGPENIFRRCLPILQCLGGVVVRVGESGAGQVAKTCNQLVVGITIAATAEALILGAKAGVDPAKIRDALLGGFAQSRVLEVHGQRMLEHAHAPGFRMSLHVKDLRIALDTANTVGAGAPLAAIVKQLMTAAVVNGGGELDHSALLQVYESLSNCRLEA